MPEWTGCSNNVISTVGRAAAVEPAVAFEPDAVFRWTVPRDRVDSRSERVDQAGSLGRLLHRSP
jgi:hypothetical protein